MRERGIRMNQFKVIHDSINPEVTAICTANHICLDCQQANHKDMDCFDGEECHEWLLIKRHTQKILNMAKRKETTEQKS